MHGRLLVTGIRGHGPGDPVFEADLEACAQAGVGGVILFDVDVPRLDGDPMDAPRNVVDQEQLRRLITVVRDRLGSHAWVSIDQEGGRVARLNPRRGFEADPSAVEFARLDGPARTVAARRQAARLAELGVDLNFAPCVDLAREPDNPIITELDRSYGADAAAVVDAATVVLDAHAEAGVAACLKHFPGHGSSRGDTHEGVVDVTDTWSHEELEPYRALARRPGLAVMAAHVVHRGLDPDLPASLSPAILQGILRGELGYDGVVVTDSIDMRALADGWSFEGAAVQAVQAGADLVVDGFNLGPGRAHPARTLVDALRDAIPTARVEESVERIDRLRHQIGRG